MKHLINIFFIFLLFTCCTNPNPKNVQEKKYTNAELIGKWNQVGTSKALQDRDTRIKFIQLKNDSVAEVQLIDPNGERMILGKWTNGFNEELRSMGMKVKSDIKISYFLEENSAYVLMLKLGEENKKLVMTAHNYKFEKE